MARTCYWGTGNRSQVTCDREHVRKQVNQQTNNALARAIAQIARRRKRRIVTRP